jgi:hypothetical protein
VSLWEDNEGLVCAIFLIALILIAVFLIPDCISQLQ